MTFLKTAGRIAAIALAIFGAAGPGRADDLSALATLDPSVSRIESAGEGIAVTLAVSQPVPYRLFLLADPPRLVIDTREVDFGTASLTRLAETRKVTDLRAGRFQPGWTRLVAGLERPYRIAVAEQRVSGSGAVIRVDLVPVPAADFASLTGAPDDAGWDLPRPAAVDAPKRRQTGEAPLAVALDPGHGGIDPGAEASGTTEAALVLAFSSELAEALRRAGMAVTLTRVDDVFVPLETRISVARAAGADVFLSLHADALAAGEAAGATVYSFDPAAADEAGQELAERHDRADLLAGVDLAGQDDEVAGVLMDLARTETAPRSARLARALAGAIQEAGLKMHRHPVQGADFSVLKSPDIPSLLLELGFLSSEADRKRLSDPAWRKAMVAAILSGLGDWALADAAEARLIRQ